MVVFPPGFHHNLLCKSPMLLRSVRWGLPLLIVTQLALLQWMIRASPELFRPSVIWPMSSFRRDFLSQQWAWGPGGVEISRRCGTHGTWAVWLLYAKLQWGYLDERMPSILPPALWIKRAAWNGLWLMVIWLANHAKPSMWRIRMQCDLISSINVHLWNLLGIFVSKMAAGGWTSVCAETGWEGTYHSGTREWLLSRLWTWEPLERGLLSPSELWD